MTTGHTSPTNLLSVQSLSFLQTSRFLLWAGVLPEATEDCVLWLLWLAVLTLWFLHPCPVCLCAFYLCMCPTRCNSSCSCLGFKHFLAVTGRLGPWSQQL